MGRRKNGTHFVRESSQRVKPWRKAVRDAARATGVYVPPGSAVAVELHFFIERPKTHCGTGRNAHLVKKSAPVFPVSMKVGDIDKLARSTFDALTQAGVIPDDSHVCQVHARKVYACPGQRGYALVTVRSLGDPLKARASKAA